MPPAAEPAAPAFVVPAELAKVPPAPAVEPSCSPSLLGPQAAASDTKLSAKNVKPILLGMKLPLQHPIASCMPTRGLIEIPPFAWNPLGAVTPARCRSDPL
jgi:hypothetical protein